MSITVMGASLWAQKTVSVQELPEKTQSALEAHGEQLPSALRQ